MSSYHYRYSHPHFFIISNLISSHTVPPSVSVITIYLRHHQIRPLHTLLTLSPPGHRTPLHTPFNPFPHNNVAARGFSAGLRLFPAKIIITRILDFFPVNWILLKIDLWLHVIISLRCCYATGSPATPIVKITQFTLIGGVLKPRFSYIVSWLYSKLVTQCSPET